MRYSRSWTGLLVTLITLAGICLPVQAQEEEEPTAPVTYPKAEEHVNTDIKDFLEQFRSD